MKKEIKDESVEARQIAKQKEYKQSLKLLWSEEDMDLFIDDFNEMIDNEIEKFKPCVDRQFLRKSQEAVSGMKKHHNLMNYMLKIENDQLDEMDELEKDCLASEAKVKIAQEKRRELEKIIDGLTLELAEAQLVNRDKKRVLETRDNQMEQANQSSKDMKITYQEKLKEALNQKEEVMNEVKSEIADVQSANKTKLQAIELANKGQIALKSALNQCSEGLQQSGVVGGDE